MAVVSGWGRERKGDESWKKGEKRKKRMKEKKVGQIIKKRRAMVFYLTRSRPRHTIPVPLRHSPLLPQPHSRTGTGSQAAATTREPFYRTRTNK